MATPPSPNDLTRQQLDELDALLQKMLALPLAQPDEPPPAPPRPADPLPGGWRADRLPPPPAPHLTAPAVYEEGPPISFDPPPPMTFEPPPQPVTAYQPPPAPKVEDFAPPVPLVVDIPPAPPIEAPAPEPAPTSDRLPVLLWPLYAANAPLEFALGLFGPPGRLMCTAGGKWALGLAGLLMLTAAGLWAARANGFVRFDLPL